MKRSQAQNTKAALTWHRNSTVARQVALSPVYKKPCSCLWSVAISGEGEGSTPACVHAGWWAAWTHCQSWREKLPSHKGVTGMMLWGRRKDFKGAGMPGRGGGKEQSVLGRVQGFWTRLEDLEYRDRADWGITGKEKAGIAVSCDCPHLRDGWAWVLPGRCSDSWTATVNKWKPPSHCNVGWGVLVCVFLRYKHLDLRTQMEGRCYRAEGQNFI